MKKIALTLALTVGSLTAADAQYTNPYQPGLIRQKLEKLNVLGNVLYVAAHPDDENTRMITYYANEKLMRTGYLSATRGDGGQNLIGPEIREQLGVIRTQELLAARATDGGQQFFSRANDFGYSKNPEETFTIWDKEKVLEDFVRVFRKFRPDIVITRFDSDGVSHGHHTASAILAREAFELAGDSAAFSDQLDELEIWKPKKIFWNTGWWWFRQNPNSDTTDLIQINVGGYNPLLGASYGEIAARSRSMHKSQGFGSTGRRGDQIEYLRQWEGEKTNRPFDGIDVSWDRVEGSEEVAFYINKAIAEFNEQNPSKITEYLILAKKALSKLKNDFWKEIKSKELFDLIFATSGLYVSLSSNDDFYTPGDSIQIDLEVINRSNVSMELKGVEFADWVEPITFGAPLLTDKVFKAELNYRVKKSTPISNAYWLKEKSTLGMYSVSNRDLIGTPENKPAIEANITISVGGELIQRRVPVEYRETDPVKGEVITPISIGPPILLNLEEQVLVFSDNQPKKVNVNLIAGKSGIQGSVKLNLPNGWKSHPIDYSFDFDREGDESMVSFEITPPKKASEGSLNVEASIGSQVYSKSRIEIDYEHIPKQVIYPDAKLRLVRVNLKRNKKLLGYIEGAGDAIPQNLEQLGYQVDLLQKEDVVAASLSKYEAIILGVRAFNTVNWLAFKNEELFKYVEEGGNLIVQYNTNRRMVTEKVAPYQLKLSRDRVSVEQAPVEMLVPEHLVLNTPNKITQQDFDGWVQERGLYFPNKWGDEFTPILSSFDPGETPKKGGLLVAKYGKGTYIYTGYSWFRELPAGVAGAYRLFVNLIELNGE